MKPIIIILDGGVVQDILNVPCGMIVEVHDYDCEGTDETVTKDADGRAMIVGRFTTTS